VTVVLHDPATARFADVPVLLHRVGELLVLGQAHNDARFERIDARFDGIDARLDGIDARLDGIDARLDRMDLAMQRGFDRIDAKFEHLVGLIIQRETGEETEPAAG
jgi:hypothetical protein